MALSLTRSRVRILSCSEKTTTPVHHFVSAALLPPLPSTLRELRFSRSSHVPSRARASKRKRKRDWERGTQTSKDVRIFFVDIYSLFGGSCMLEERICCWWFCWCRESALHGFSVLHRPGGFLRHLHSRRLAEVSAPARPVSHSTAESIIFLFFFLVCFFEMFVSIGCDVFDLRLIAFCVSFSSACMQRWFFC